MNPQFMEQERTLFNKTTAQLNHALWLYCKSALLRENKLPARWGNEDDIIRARRESVVGFVSEQSRGVAKKTSDYTQLTDYELVQCIVYLRDGVYEGQRASIREFATAEMRRKLRRLVIIYCLYNWSFDMSICDQTTGEIITGEELRTLSIELFNNGNLTGTILNEMQKQCGHPAMHIKLKHAGYRHASIPEQKLRTMYYFKWDEILHDECMHLIKIFQKMNQEYSARYTNIGADRVTIVSHLDNLN